MRAIIGLSLLLIAGVLLYEVVKGNAVNIINAIRGTSTSTTSSSSSSNSNNGGKSIQQTPQDIQRNPNNGVA
jgi:hypothetical protein